MDGEITPAHAQNLHVGLHEVPMSERDSTGIMNDDHEPNEEGHINSPVNGIAAAVDETLKIRRGSLAVNDGFPGECERRPERCGWRTR